MISEQQALICSSRKVMVLATEDMGENNENSILQHCMDEEISGNYG